MKYSETGFRPFYHHFTAIPVNENIRNLLAEFQGGEEADHLLTYGYIDPEKGLMLEVLAPAIAEGGRIHFGSGNPDVHIAVPIGETGDGEFLYFADESGNLAGLFGEKIEALQIYNGSEEVEKTREMAFLDGSRNEPFVDEIRVFLVRDGLEPEQRPVRIEGIGEGCIIGVLLEEPQQNFHYHKGDKVAFFVQKQEDRIVCFTDLNPPRRLKAADLEDGSMLEEAVRSFKQARDQEHLLDLLEILRDSKVWVPCTTVRTGKKTRLEPDILQNISGQHYFPVFSTQEAMGKYGKGFTRVQKTVPGVISLAKKNAKRPEGIVLNPFTEEFVLEKELWDVVTQMKSMLE